MSLQSKSFSVRKGETLESIAQFLEGEIGLNAFLVLGIKGVALSRTLTQLTVVYEKYAPSVVDSIAPRPGAIFTSDIASNDFDIRVLFNEPIDFQSIQSGVISIDGVGLPADKVYLDPDTNNYFIKISASGAAFQTESFHTYQISSEMQREDGSSLPYSPIGGYLFHGLSSAHIGDYPKDYMSRRRGRIAVGVISISKGLSPQQGIREFLSQKQLEDSSLITYTPITRDTNLVDVYFIYIKDLEPQILEGFPLDNSLLPDVSAPDRVSFVFSTPLDSSRLSSVTGLFSVESDFSTSVDVPPDKITLLDDRQTVEIDTSTYFTQQKVYSILAKPGILGSNGLSKEKPEQWTIHISPYEGVTGGALSGVSQVDFDNFYAEFTGHTGQTDVHYLQSEIDIGTGQINDLPPLVSESAFLTLSGQVTGLSGDLSSHTGDASIHFTEAEISHTNIADIGTNTHAQIDTHIASTSNPHSVTAEQVGSPTVGEFTSLSGSYTGHTGETGVHFTQAEIVITASQLDAESSTDGYVLTSDGAGNAGWEELPAGGGGVTSGEFTGHTGDTSIHYTMASISITESQVSDLGTYAQESVFTGHTGDATIHYTQAEISITTGQISDFGNYASYGPFTGHTGDTSNPHSVTAAQVGAPTIAEYTGLSGDFASHEADTTIHYTKASITTSELGNVESIEVYNSGEILKYTSAKGGVFEAVNYTLSTMDGVEISSPGIDDVLKFDGTNWINGSVPGGGADSDTRFTDLTDVTILTGSTGNASSQTGQLVMYNVSSGEYTDFQLLPAGASTLTMDDSNRLAIITTTALEPANNLSDVSSEDEARRNLKVRYKVEDFTDTVHLSSSDNVGAGSSYSFATNSRSFMLDGRSLGVITASNGSTATAGTAGATRTSNGFWTDLTTTGAPIYFRTAIDNTATNLTRFGLTRTVFSGTGDVEDGAYFEHDSSVGSNWYACTASGNTRTKTDTSVAAVADTWKWWAIESASSGVYFYDADGSIEGPSDAVAFLSTNIPSSANSEMRVFINCVSNGSTFRHMWLDKIAYPLYYDGLPSGLPLSL